MALGLLGGLLLAGGTSWLGSELQKRERQKKKSMLDQSLGQIQNTLFQNPNDPVAQSQALMQMQQLGMSPQAAQSILSPFAQPDPTSQMRNFAAYQQMDPASQQQYLEFKRAGGVNIGIGQGGVGVPYTAEQKRAAGFAPEAVVIPDKQGIPRIISKEQFTQPQIQAGGFANRMETAAREFESLTGGDFNPAGLIQNIDMFGAPEIMANFFRSPEGQRYRQAQENWVTANLRKESGAVISDQEMENEIKKWFPQPFDSKQVIEQKARARKDAELNMRKASGGAYKDLREQSDMQLLEDLRRKQGPIR